VERLYDSPELKYRIESDRELQFAVEKLEKGQVAAVFVKTTGGHDISNLASDPITRDNYREFMLDKAAVAAALVSLAEKQFEILYVGDFAIIVRATTTIYAREFETEFIVKTSRAFVDFQKVRADDLMLTPTNNLPRKRAEEFPVDHMLLPPELDLHQPSTERPTIAEDQIDEDDLRCLLNVPKPPRTGVLIGIADTGFEVSNPVLKARQIDYELAKQIGDFQQDVDANGHGTAMYAVATAVAPKARFLLSSIRPDGYSAIERLTKAGVRVLSCSFGWSENCAADLPHVRCALYAALDTDIVVVMSAGNLGKHSWMAALHEVIAVGGGYPGRNGLEPSNLTSSYPSAADPDRYVPDLCGLAGMSPRRPYLLVPVPAGSTFDRDSAAADRVLASDDSGEVDGWAFTSFSSAAAAQVAAIAGLVRAANPALERDEIKEILLAKATFIPHPPAADKSAPNAAGSGLVNAGAAIGEALRRGEVAARAAGGTR
jgi:hypothetical protein